MSQFQFKPDTAARILWHVRPACGETGCACPQCVCSLCGKPIGVSEDDPRWGFHDEFCGGCELCNDQVPLVLFRGEGRAMQRAQFHTACFTAITEFSK